MNSQIKALVRLTVQDPRAAAAGLMSDKLACANAFPLIVLVVILGVLASILQLAILPVQTNVLMDTLLGRPILFAMIQLIALMVSVFAIHYVGRIFKCRGNLDQAMLISAWLQFFTLIIQIFVIFVALISTPLAEMLNTVTYIFFIWLMVNFIAELHGFRSLWKVLGGIIGSSVAASFLVLLVLAMLGVNIEGV